MKMIKKLLLVSILFIYSCGGSSDTDSKPNKAPKIDPDIQKVKELISEQCFEVLDLHSRKYWANEVGSQNIPNSISIWTKKSEDGKGVIKGNVDIGARLIFVDEHENDYKIATSTDGKLIIGFISKIQISKKMNFNKNSGKECMIDQIVQVKYKSWIRSQPNGVDNYIRVPKKTKLLVLDEKVTNNDIGNNQIVWYKVEYKDKVGWISEFNTK